MICFLADAVRLCPYHDGKLLCAARVSARPQLGDASVVERATAVVQNPTCLHIPIQCLQQNQHCKYPDLGGSEVQHTGLYATWRPVSNLQDHAKLLQGA